MTYWLCTRDKLSGPTTNVHSEFIKTENDRLTHLKTDNRLFGTRGRGIDCAMKSPQMAVR